MGTNIYTSYNNQLSQSELYDILNDTSTDLKFFDIENLGSSSISILKQVTIFNY